MKQWSGEISRIRGYQTLVGFELVVGLQTSEPKMVSKISNGYSATVQLYIINSRAVASMGTWTIP